MEKYTEYKNSGIDWIGQIPVHWEVKPLFTVAFENKVKNSGSQCANLLSLSYGKIVKKDIDTSFGLLPESFETYQIAEDGYTILRLTDLQNDKRSLRSGFVPEKGIITSAYVGLIPADDVDGLFLSDLLHAYDLMKIFYSLGNGVRQSMNYKDLKRLPILLPPKCEQKLISKNLKNKTEKIDNIIADKETLLELLKEKRQAIISEAVTRGLNPFVPMKDSGVDWIGQIPKHWEMSRIGFETWVRARLGWKGLKAEEYVDEGFAFLATPNIKGRDIDFDNVNYITKERYDESPEIKLRPNDVLLAKDGSTLGTVNVVRALSCEATVNSSIAVITPSQSMSGLFLKYLFESSYLKNIIQMKKDGMGVPHLFQADIVKFAIPKPPLEEQLIIAEYLDEKTMAVDSNISNSEQQISLLKEYRQSIISEAVTGKIKVADSEIAATLEQPKAKTNGANIHFKRRVLAARILDKLCVEPTLGHVKLEKLLFLSEYCAQLDMQTEYVRHAAGPYNPQVLRSIDAQLQKAKWFVYNKNNRGSKYGRLDKSTEYAPYFESNFTKEQSNSIDRILRLLRTWDTEHCEIVATLYGAWNDFLIDGITPSDDQIVDEVLTHWSEEKQRIDRSRWLKAVDWMRKNNMAPCGYGNKTKRREN